MAVQQALIKPVISRLQGYFLSEKLEIIIFKATKLFNLPRDFFFHPSINLRLSFWKEDLVKYAVLSLTKPKKNISHIDNDGKFYYNIIYDLAINIQVFYEWIYNIGKVTEPYAEYTIGMSLSDIGQLKDDLSRQYYKVLEQYPEGTSNKICPIAETIIEKWFNAADHYISRIIIESISNINIKDPNNPKIKYRFLNDIMRRKVVFAGYDSLGLKMELRNRGSFSVS